MYVMSQVFETMREETSVYHDVVKEEMVTNRPDAVIVKEVNEHIGNRWVLHFVFFLLCSPKSLDFIGLRTPPK